MEPTKGFEVNLFLKSFYKIKMESRLLLSKKRKIIISSCKVFMMCLSTSVDVKNIFLKHLELPLIEKFA